MLGAMDSHPVRIVVGTLLALAAASTLVWSIGKPPEWTPEIYGWFKGAPRQWGRNRVRLVSAGAFVAGAVVALYFGVFVH